MTEEIRDKAIEVIMDFANDGYTLYTNLSGLKKSPEYFKRCKSISKMHIKKVIKEAKKYNTKYEEETYWSPVDYWGNVLEELEKL